MNTDAAFVKGASHSICQDYALAKKSCVVVSDGCSSGRHTDMGARFWAWMYSYNVGRVIHNQVNNEEWLEEVRDMARRLNLRREDLVATVLGVDALSDTAFVFGDGYLFRMYDGRLVIWDIEYEQNAPFYLAYRLFPGEEQIWREQFPKNNKVCTEWWFDENLKFVRKLRTRLDDNAPELALHGSLSVPGFQWYGVATDGLGSVQDANKNPVPFEEVVPHFFSFKNMHQPGFVQRRLQMVEREFKKKGWSHYDDIAMGVLSNE